MFKQLLKATVIKILTWQAKLVLKKYNPKIVAVTGSVGKTSTKDAIFTMLSKFYFVRRSEKSFNSELGVPLTILGVPNGWNNPFVWIKNIIEGLTLIVLPNLYPQWLVLEIGADRPGDIASLTSWIKPDIGVVTILSKMPVHVEYFLSVAEIVREKSFLIQNTKREGIVVLNGDDEDVRAFQGLVENKIIFYGLKGADITFSDYVIEYLPAKNSLGISAGEPEEISSKISSGLNNEIQGISFTVSNGKSSEQVKILRSIGLQHVYPVLASIAVSHALNLPFKKSAKAFKNYETPAGRMKIIKGIKDTIIIDDTYNSSPVALEEALKTLGEIMTKARKVAVLADMLELGVYSVDEHRKLGVYVAKNADILIAAGLRTRALAEAAQDNGMSEKNIFQYNDSQDAGRELQNIIKEGDIILVKGSQGMRMGRGVEEIMAEPDKKEELLVRQDKEWQNR